MLHTATPQYEEDTLQYAEMLENGNADLVELLKSNEAVEDYFYPRAPPGAQSRSPISTSGAAAAAAGAGAGSGAGGATSSGSSGAAAGGGAGMGAAAFS